MAEEQQGGYSYDDLVKMGAKPGGYSFDELQQLGAKPAPDQNIQLQDILAKQKAKYPSAQDLNVPTGTDLRSAPQRLLSAVMDPTEGQNVRTMNNPMMDRLIGASLPGGPATNGMTLLDAANSSPMAEISKAVVNSPLLPTYQKLADFLMKNAADVRDAPTQLTSVAKQVPGAQVLINALSKLRAPVEEGLAKAVTAGARPPEFNVSPTPEAFATPQSAPPVMNAVGADATKPLVGGPIAGYTGGRSAPAPEIPNNPVPSALPANEPPDVLGRIVQQQQPPRMPSTPIAAENQAWLQQMRSDLAPDWLQGVDTKAPVQRGEDLVFDKELPAKSAFHATPDVMAIERAIAPSGMNARLQTLRNVPKLMEELPDLKPGPNFDSDLLAGFKNAEVGVDKAESSVPDATLVPRTPIVTQFKALESDYAARGLDKAAKTMGDLADKWSALPENVPWPQFVAMKRAFFNELPNSGPAMRAYGALMNATSEISPALAEANSSYSVLRRALDTAKIDIATGRRISQVGKAVNDTMVGRAQKALDYAKKNPTP